MLKYEIVKSDNGFQLFELDTEHVIDTYADRRIAQKKAKFFARGGGFFGWTPKFITVKVSAAT